MKPGHMIVTERHQRIYGTENFDVLWVISKRMTYGVRRYYYYSAEAVRHAIENWPGTVRFRLTKER